jgi:predicted N-acyltransferase
MSLDVQVMHSVAEVGQESWDRLSAGRPFTSYRWYRFGEQAMSYAWPVYIILLRQGEPVARATFWLTSKELIPTRMRLVRSMLGSLLRRWPLLICQAPLTSAAAMSGLIVPDPPLRDEALEVLAETALALGRKHRVSFSIFAYLEAEESRWPAWPSQFARTILYGSGTRMSIEWSDFEGYLAHLNKKRRYNIRRNCRLAEERGIELTVHETVGDVEGAMALHRNISRHHNTSSEPWMRGALEHAGMVDSLWLKAEVDGRMVGCELMLGDQGSWLVTGLGLDYDVDLVYFVLGYKDIECAIEREARILRWGSLTYDVKRRLGFELESNDWVLFAGRATLMQKAGRWLTAMEERQSRDSYEF